MNYILMHKNIAVLPMEIDLQMGAISQIGTATAPLHIPIGVSHTNNFPDRGDLNDWWQGRSIPASRQNIRQALKTM